jgi:outer membrane immunogenic protein
MHVIELGGPNGRWKIRGAAIALVVAAGLNACIGSESFAADVAAPVPAYTKAPPAPAAYNWTGFYVGGNVGYSWGRSSNDWNFFAQNSSFLSASCSGLGGGDNAFCAAGSDSNKLNGAIGGLQTGYNWQTGSFLAGVETDFQFSGQKVNQTFNTRFSTGAANDLFNAFGALSASYTEKLKWLGTARGRIGFTADRWLIYATCGLAYGEVSVSGSASATSLGVPVIGCAGPVCPLASWSNNVTKAGWTVGTGVEGAINDNWSVKVEYLHVDLGGVRTGFATLPGIYGNITTRNGAFISAFAGSGTIKSNVTDEIVRLGINYKFGGPVVARY